MPPPDDPPDEPPPPGRLTPPPPGRLTPPPLEPLPPLVLTEAQAVSKNPAANTAIQALGDGVRLGFDRVSFIVFSLWVRGDRENY